MFPLKIRSRGPTKKGGRGEGEGGGRGVSSRGIDVNSKSVEKRGRASAVYPDVDAERRAVLSLPRRSSLFT